MNTEFIIASNLARNTTKLALKHVRTSHQLDYLRLAKQQKFLPRGIAEQMNFTSAVHDDELQSSLQNLMHFSGSRILDLMIIYYTKWSNNIRASYYSNLAKLESSESKENFMRFKNNLNYKMAKEKAVAEKTQESKLKRDIQEIKCPYKEIAETQLPTQLRKKITHKLKKKKAARRKRKMTKHTRNKNRTDVKGVIPSLNTIQEDKLKSCVINLSRKEPNITSHQLYLFFLGKSFAPTPPLPDYSKFKLDILQFAYRLRWTWYWFNNPKPQVESESSPKLSAIRSMEQTLIKTNETKQIRTTNNHCLELYIGTVTTELLQTNSKTKTTLPDNLPPESREALNKMKDWKDVVIRRSADKGSKYFILDI